MSMRVLNNVQEWRAWCREENFARAPHPDRYPCIPARKVTDGGMQESVQLYVYLDELTQPNPWISTAQQIPNNDRLVLIVIGWSELMLMVARWDGELWIAINGKISLHSVTHWMDIPALPRAEVKP